jgi:large subunit ribosomal protein L29
MKASDLREKSAEDLTELQKTLARDVFQNRLKNFTNRLDDTSAIRKSRRDLARVITLLRERSGGIVRTTPAAKPAPAAARPAKPAKAPEVEAEAPKERKVAAKAPEAAPSKPAKKTAAKKTTSKASKKDDK